MYDKIHPRILQKLSRISLLKEEAVEKVLEFKKSREISFHPGG